MKLSNRQLRRVIREELHNEVRHPATTAPGMADGRFVWEFGEFTEADEVEELEELDLARALNIAIHGTKDIGNVVRKSVGTGLDAAGDVAEKVASGRGAAALRRTGSGIKDTTIDAVGGTGDVLQSLTRRIKNESQLRVLIRCVLISEYYSR